MNTRLILLALSVTAFGSCTTLYKSGQTPDDVYFSPVRTYGEDKEEEQQQRDEVKTYSHEDRTIRFGINDPRWRNFDNDYRYNSFDYGFNYGFNDFSNNPFRFNNRYNYNPYSYGFNHGYYYNPYYWPHPIYSNVYTVPVNRKNTTPRVANLGGYNTNGSATRSTNTKTGNAPVRNYSTTNKGSAVGNILRQVITPSNDNNSNYNNNNSRSSSSSNNNSNNNTRSYTPSSNSGSSSSGRSSSSGSGAVSRPPRGGGN